MFSLKLNSLKLLNVKLKLKKNKKVVFRDQLNVDVMIELYETTIHWLFLSLLTLDRKKIIIHPNRTNKKYLNNFNYNRAFTLLGDHYFQEKLEQYETIFTVYNFN